MIFQQKKKRVMGLHTRLLILWHKKCKNNTMVAPFILATGPGKCFPIGKGQQ